jgi:hypothetical protein
VQHEQHAPDGDGFAEVWRSAQHRRSEDACLWFTDIVKERWQFKSPSKYLGLLFRSLTRSGESFVTPETGRPALKDARTKGGRSGS